MRRYVVAAILTILLAAPSAAERPTVFIDAGTATDASNARVKGKFVDCGAAIAAALLKKQVPVLVVTDASKAQWTIKSMSSQKEDSTGTKAAKLAFGEGLFGGGFTK